MVECCKPVSFVLHCFICFFSFFQATRKDRFTKIPPKETVKRIIFGLVRVHHRQSVYCKTRLANLQFLKELFKYVPRRRYNIETDKHMNVHSILNKVILF